jgi:D-glycerate 3-kinase
MDISSFLTTHQLPDSYNDIAQQWFIPLIDDILEHQNGAKGPFFVGLNGCQGSGKSTLSDFIVYVLTEHHNLSVVSLSLDDFYLDQASRHALAQNVHPLLQTRGVPGTHDVALAQSTFDQLQRPGTVAIPRFNKAIDNPIPKDQWQTIKSPPDVVIVEGWCWGTPAQTSAELIDPVNTLEADEDALGIWRGYVNQQLTDNYQPLYNQMNYWVMLKAPSFKQVYHWRLEQEQKLAAKVTDGSSGIMNESQIARFIQHYQRLTEHSLKTLPERCNQVFHLDATRQITFVDKAVK